jgi:hypothetical protein
VLAGFNQLFGFAQGCGINEHNVLQFRRTHASSARILSIEECVLRFSDTLSRNALGKEAWELAGVFTDNPFVHFYFKRLTG